MKLYLTYQSILVGFTEDPEDNFTAVEKAFATIYLVYYIFYLFLVFSYLYLSQHISQNYVFYTETSS